MSDGRNTFIAHLLGAYYSANIAHVHSFSPFGHCWNHCGYDERVSDPVGYWARMDGGVLAEPKCRFCGREFASRTKLEEHLGRLVARKTLIMDIVLAVDFVWRNAGTMNQFHRR
jgi:hypothetical protein